MNCVLTSGVTTLGILAGSVVGIVLLISLTVSLTCCYLKRSKKHSPVTTNQSEADQYYDQLDGNIERRPSYKKIDDDYSKLQTTTDKRYGLNPIIAESNIHDVSQGTRNGKNDDSGATYLELENPDRPTTYMDIDEAMEDYIQPANVYEEMPEPGDITDTNSRRLPATPPTSHYLSMRGDPAGKYIK